MLQTQIDERYQTTTRCHIIYSMSRAGVNSERIGIDQLNSGIGVGIGIERFGTKLIELELKDLELNWN